MTNVAFKYFKIIVEEKNRREFHKHAEKETIRIIFYQFSKRQNFKFTQKIFIIQNLACSSYC